MLKPVFHDWGLIDYESALKKQLELVEQVSQDEIHPGFFIFCTHPPVVTTGRQTQLDDIFAWNGRVVEVSRGGRATYHGPSQLVVYPILNLKLPRAGRGAQEIRGFLRALEQCVVETLALYGISAAGKTPQKLPGEQVETDETGVWVSDQKIASVGIAVKKWTTYHGVAINLDNDPLAFQGLNPCGFKSATMTNLELQCGRKISRDEFSQNLLKKLNQIL